ncbi:hypothetical protein PRZ48_005540 [Zasmidium cellare]|uniref:Amidohydrolase-related domain-containing protein n=1 Tax=Zasmidium cellare TaxID=395010 RepID=A0ABR0EKT2_ZASCE|nr:hypothetical protein PRZ48_005540 [Zasmidium cellare]
MTPRRASVSQYEAFKQSLGLSRSVLVHGLSYKDNCTPLKAFVADLGTDRTTGVAVISRTTTDAEISNLHAAGVRGVRLDLYSQGAMHDLDKQVEILKFYSSRIAPWNWSLGFLQLNASNWDKLAPLIPTLPVDVVVDHHALLKAKSRLPGDLEVAKQPGLKAIVRLLKGQNFWIKLSAPYRCSDAAPYYEDMEEIVRTLVKVNPRRVVWGSDWPHTPKMAVRSKEEALKEIPFLQIDDDAWLMSLRRWLTDDEWQLLMVDNPRRLFGLR